MPCNVIPDEILTDHPERFRAMIVESSNPAHSLADSQRFREAFEALELLVVIDVAMTETARLADYVLPAASQFEKPEATFFNFEFPRNTFHLRHPLLEPLPGTLPEPEIWARLVRALGRGRRRGARAAARGRRARAGRPTPQALVRGDGGRTRRSPSCCPTSSTRRSARRCPTGLAGAAALWGLAQRCAMTYPDAVRRAGHADGDALFDAILDGRSGVTFTRRRVRGRLRATSAIPTSASRSRSPRCSPSCAALRDGASRAAPTTSCPIVLSVGERRSYTANDIFRDPGWRKRDADGALRVSARGRDAARAGRRRPARGSRPPAAAPRPRSRSATRCSAGHASLPNGFGLDFTDADGETRVAGVAPNSLTSSDWRDAFAGTPWHKHVPARIEPVAS